MRSLLIIALLFPLAGFAQIKNIDNTERAPETLLSLFLTDASGQLYPGMPLIKIRDAVTGQVVKEFYRNADMQGNPDPIKLRAGTYWIKPTHLDSFKLTLIQDRHNKVFLYVKKGSLRFRYEDTPDKPMVGYEALVNIRFLTGKAIRQKCNEELEYPPGEYFVEVNTLPISRFVVNIDFGAVTVIELREPGLLQIINPVNCDSISLYAPIGNKFVKFIELGKNDKGISKPLQLKPGSYEAHWRVGKGGTEKNTPFRIEQNKLKNLKL